MKIKPSFSVSLFDVGSDVASDLIVHPHPDNENEWTELVVRNINYGKVDTERSIIFENKSLNDIIKALELYRDSIKAIK
jgi:hypothetical protein